MSLNFLRAVNVDIWLLAEERMLPPVPTDSESDDETVFDALYDLYSESELLENSSDDDELMLRPQTFIIPDMQGDYEIGYYRYSRLEVGLLLDEIQIGFNNEFDLMLMKGRTNRVYDYPLVAQSHFYTLLQGAHADRFITREDINYLCYILGVVNQVTGRYLRRCYEQQMYLLKYDRVQKPIRKCKHCKTTYRTFKEYNSHLYKSRHVTSINKLITAISKGKMYDDIIKTIYYFLY